MEAVEDAMVFFGWYPDAAVAYRHGDAVLGRGCDFEVHGSSCWGVADGVGEEVGQHPLDEPRVGYGMDLCDLDLEVEAGGLGGRGEESADALA